jgi:truncated hemoglobin YjbI
MTAKQNTKQQSVSDNEQTYKIWEEAQSLRESDEELGIESKLSVQSIDARSSDKMGNTTKNLEETTSHSYKFIPLKMGGGGRTHVVSNESKRLMEEEVTLADLEKVTSFFYEQAFLDPTLDQFIRSHDDPHASRFAMWIHQKLSGSTVWDEERAKRSQKPVKLAHGIHHIVHDRSSAHAAAWYSPKRPSKDVGRNFKLDECRVWMRLHFWALRESGLMEKSPGFADYYVRFIAHFVRVYESTAPTFARDSLRWSEDPNNIEQYIQNNRRMVDVLGLSHQEALSQIPMEEATDDEYPYHHTPQ